MKPSAKRGSTLAVASILLLAAPLIGRAQQESGRRVSQLRDRVDATRRLPAGADSVKPAPLRQEIEALRVDLGGYGSVRYEANDADAVPSSITLRRFVVTTDARLGPRFQVYSEVEYERLQEIEVERSSVAEEGGVTFAQELEGSNGGALELEQAWGQFTASRALALRLGVVLPPVGRFNIRHDDNLWNFANRPLIDRDANVLPAAAAWHEMGLGAAGEVPVGSTGLLSYEVYLLNGVQLDFALDQKREATPGGGANLVTEAEVSPQSGAADGSNRADALAARVQLSPALGSEFAVSGYVGRYTPEFLDRGQTLGTVGLDGRQKVGPAYLEGEFLYTRFGGLEETIRDFAAAILDHSLETEGEAGGLSAEGEVELAGLSKSRYGFWIDLSVPLPLRRGALGLEDAVIAPVARYERVWFRDNLEELDFAGGVVTDEVKTDRQQGRLALGLAFRPVPQAAIQLLYRRDDAIDGALLAPEVDAGSTNGVLLGMAFGF